MDFKYTHGTDVYVVRACYHEDATDLVAIAGDQSVEILQCHSNRAEVIASFPLGQRPTALAWSPRTVSPGTSDDWVIELAVSTHDFGLHILTKSSPETTSIFRFGGGLTGHHGRINDISFVGGRDRSARHLASASEDKNLIVWDLFPPLDLNSDVSSPVLSMDGSQSFEGAASRPQPTALVIPFAHPLTSVSSHPSTSKEFVVSDTRGSVFLTDWRHDPTEDDDAWHHIVELTQPRSLADSVTHLSSHSMGHASWRMDNADQIGAVYGSKYALWDMTDLRGGKPHASGVSFADGGHRFRWCPTYPEYFALSSNSPQSGAAIHFYNTNYVQAQPTIINIATRPHRMMDFDWLSVRGIPRVAAAVGRDVYIFSIGVDQVPVDWDA